MAGRKARELAEAIAKISPHLVHGARMAVSIAALTPPDVVLRMETDICLSSRSGVIVGEAAQQSVREE